jgi:tRNA pseudouridine13 synthase
MKLKQQPEDFCVEEIAEPSQGDGRFALYRLAKKSLGTPEAIGAICSAWRLNREAVAVGGLKDRHAVTRQYLSIENGPRRKLTQTNFSLEYLGQTSRSFESSDISANRFEIVIRDLGQLEVENIATILPAVIEGGVPNYFDDQRFGSVGQSGDFVARPWCSGDYDRALWLALAEPNSHDRPGVREEKVALCAHWGNWESCRKNAVRPVTRAALERLCRQPGDTRGAFIRIPQHERRMYLEAFQSFLWNRVLAESVRANFDTAELFDVEIGRMPAPFYRAIPTPEVRGRLDQPLPLPSARERAELGPLSELYERVAGEFGLECRTLRVKYPRDSFFSRGSRRALFSPRDCATEPADDELNTGRRKLLLRFELPPGCYATVLIKRLTAAPWLPPAAAT